MVQYEVRQKKNDIVGAETIAEQLTNYDELSNKDKMGKYRLFLHSLFGARTGLEISKVIVSYIIVISFALFMFYYTSKVYNVVDRIFANAEVSVNSHLAILRDMQFEAQSAVQVKPILDYLVYSNICRASGFLAMKFSKWEESDYHSFSLFQIGFLPSMMWFISSHH